MKKGLRVFLIVGMSFSLPLNARVIGIEYKFGGAPDGAFPASRLVLDGRGNFYGTTSLGGDYGCANYGTCGTVFKMTFDQDGSWTKSIIYRFTGESDGGVPGPVLALDRVGNLYGTTQLGGGGTCFDSCGTVFELAPGPSGKYTETTLYTFLGENDGGQPEEGVILDSSGSLYGTTENGGICDPGCHGTVFRLTPNGDGEWQETTLYSFRDEDGYGASDLIFDTAGNLYGALAYGGNSCNCGSVFELSPSQDGSWTYEGLYMFTGAADGGNPTSGVVRDGKGNLYGETAHGGDFEFPAGGCGVVYELTPESDGWHENVMHAFRRSDGCEPAGGLSSDGAGHLYGTASGGDDDGTELCTQVGGCGNVFEFSQRSGVRATYNVIGVFNGKDGMGPGGGVVIDATGYIYGTTALGGHPACAPWGCGTVFQLFP